MHEGVLLSSCVSIPALPLQEFVDIEAEDAIEVSISTDPNLGTVYRSVGLRRMQV